MALIYVISPALPVNILTLPLINAYFAPLLAKLASITRPIVPHVDCQILVYSFTCKMENVFSTAPQDFMRIPPIINVLLAIQPV